MKTLSLIVLGAAGLVFGYHAPALIGALWRRYARKTHDAVTPHWVNEHAYDRDHGESDRPEAGR